MLTYSRRRVWSLLGVCLACTLLLCKFYWDHAKEKSSSLTYRNTREKSMLESREISHSVTAYLNSRVKHTAAVVHQTLSTYNMWFAKKKPTEHRKQDKYNSAIYITVSGGSAGRLGNRMFQYAALIGLANAGSENGTKLIPVVDKNSHLNSLFEAFRLGSADNLSLKYPVVITEEKPMSHSPGILDKIQPGYNYTIMTYLQSWKYFAKFSQEIRKEFSFKGDILTEAEKFIQAVANGSSKNLTLVGVHVRRGDMTLINSRKRGYTPANATYLQKALDYYRSKYSNVIFIVCSDDLGWSQKHVIGSDVRFSNNAIPEVDLAILSLCTHSVITSGSFGWWGAWLAGGDVVYYRKFPYPGTWLDSTCTKSDYFPQSWIGID